MTLAGEDRIAAVTRAGFRSWGASRVGGIPRPDDVMAFVLSGAAGHVIGARAVLIPSGSA